MRPRYAHTNGVTENSASLTRRRLYAGAGECRRRRSAAHVYRCMYPRRGRGLTESVTARAVGQRLWSSGVPPARRQQGRVESRHAALRSAYRVMAECRRSATMSADVGGDGVTRPLARSGWRRCSGAGMVSVEDEVRRADPLSVNPGQRPGREDDEICTAGRCRCRCSAGVCQRRRSAAHVRRRVYPRRGRGLTEGVTARAVRLCHCCARR